VVLLLVAPAVWMIIRRQYGYPALARREPRRANLAPLTLAVAP
jgi:hypothetical protein